MEADVAPSGGYVELAFAVGIGLATRPIHGRVGRIVDDLFFRERHEAAASLRRFAGDLVFVDDAAIALERGVAKPSTVTIAPSRVCKRDTPVRTRPDSRSICRASKRVIRRRR